MKKYLSAKTLFPVFLFCFEGYWLMLTTEIRITSVDEGAFATSASFPRFILLIMMACTIAVLISELSAAGKSAAAAETDPKARMDVIKVLALVLVIAGYVLLFDRLGFILTTILMMLIANALYGQRNKILAVSISVVFPVLLYLVFRYALKIMLPTLLL